MEKEPCIIGKNLTPEDREELKGWLERIREQARQPIEGEFEKTENELKFIERVNLYIAEEFEELGLKDKPEVKPEQVHLLPKEIFDEWFPELGSQACSSGNRQAIYIDKSASMGLELPVFKSILHESLHLASRYKFRKEEGVGAAYRFGYKVYNPKSDHEHFSGLNEAVIDKIAKEIFEKREKELTDEFGFSENEKKTLFWYDEYIRPLETIIEKIAAKNGETEEEAWRRFKKGLFTGEMMHLREVEKTFGKEALKIFAALGSGTKNLSKDEVNEKVARYFETGDSEERQKLAKTILGKGVRRIKIEFE